jgi:hypothetical protein
MAQANRFLREDIQGFTEDLSKEDIRYILLSSYLFLLHDVEYITPKKRTESVVKYAILESLKVLHSDLSF